MGQSSGLTGRVEPIGNYVVEKAAGSFASKVRLTWSPASPSVGYTRTRKANPYFASSLFAAMLLRLTIAPPPPRRGDYERVRIVDVQGLFAGVGGDNVPPL